MNELVQRLSNGTHPVRASLRPEATPQALRECIDRGYVHVEFTNTRGGTELGFELDRERSEVNSADFGARVGAVTLVGELTLNYVKVRCAATIDLKTLEGEGHLEPLPP